MAMSVIYKKKTSDGVDVHVWEDGLITGRSGEQLPKIGKKKLSTKVLAFFAGEVAIFTEAELWALFQACREASMSSDRVLPGNIRKRAAELLGETSPATASAMVLSHFIKANRDAQDSYSDFMELAQNWLDHAEDLVRGKSFGPNLTKCLKECQECILHAAEIVTKKVPQSKAAASFQGLKVKFNKAHELLSEAYDLGFEALASGDMNKQKVASKALVNAYGLVSSLEHDLGDSSKTAANSEMTYEDSWPTTVSKKEAYREVVKRHGMEWEDFVADMGDREEYSSKKVLEWLGY